LFNAASLSECSISNSKLVQFSGSHHHFCITDGMQAHGDVRILHVGHRLRLVAPVSGVYSSYTLGPLQYDYDVTYRGGQTIAKMIPAF
jgi:hypothetical protein